MTTDPLNPSRENLQRAHRKFDELKLTFRGFTESNPFTIRVHHECGLFHIIASRVRDLPADLAFDTVEILGRLRAALDKAVVAIVTKNGYGTSGVGFPFGGIDRNTWQGLPFPDGRVIDRLKKKLTVDQWDFLLAQRPYPRGNDALWAINEIANEDKHRRDLVTVRPIFRQTLVPRNRGVTIRMDYFQFAPLEFQHVLADEERETVLLSVGPVMFAAIREEMQHRLSVWLAFGPIVPVAGKEVLTTLEEQIQETEKIIDGFARLI